MNISRFSGAVLLFLASVSTLPAQMAKAQLGFFFCNDTAATEISTLSLHDALPISPCASTLATIRSMAASTYSVGTGRLCNARSEEHTSELQSRRDLVCRLLLE